MANRINVFVVDDHALFREGLLRLLEKDSHLKIVGSAGTVEDTLRQVPNLPIDVLILDYDLGSKTALDLIRLLQQQKFTSRCLVVTAGLPDHDALELVRLGISGIFHKHRSPEALHKSILEVAQGKVCIEQNYFQSLLQSASVSREAPVRLTDREKQILRRLLEGCSNKEIASNLQISESAVKASLQQLFAKTNVRTRSQLVRITLEQLRDEI